MASEQVRRDNITNLREIPIEDKDRVPKVADRRLGASAEKIHGGSFAADVHGLPGGIRVTGTNTNTQRPTQPQKEKNVEQERQGKKWPSLEEAGRHRAAAAQQNTTEALRAAEERYEKVKESERQAVDMAAEKARKAAEKANKAAEVSSQYAARKTAETGGTFISEDKFGYKNAVAGEGPRDINNAGVNPQEEGGGGVLRAIGETIVEIGLTAQDIVGGPRRSK